MLLVEILKGGSLVAGMALLIMAGICLGIPTSGDKRDDIFIVAVMLALGLPLVVVAAYT